MCVKIPRTPRGVRANAAVPRMAKPYPFRWSSRRALTAGMQESPVLCYNPMSITVAMRYCACCKSSMSSRLVCLATVGPDWSSLGQLQATIGWPMRDHYSLHASRRWTTRSGHHLHRRVDVVRRRWPRRILIGDCCAKRYPFGLDNTR